MRSGILGTSVFANINDIRKIATCSVSVWSKLNFHFWISSIYVETQLHSIFVCLNCFVLLFFQIRADESILHRSCIPKHYFIKTKFMLRFFNQNTNGSFRSNNQLVRRLNIYNCADVKCQIMYKRVEGEREKEKDRKK